MSDTEQGAQIGMEAPASDSVEAMTSHNTTLAVVKTEVKKLLTDLKNLPADAQQELERLWDAFHHRATIAVSENATAETDPLAGTVNG